MALFNPQTQYTTNVDTANSQIQSEANEAATYYSNLIQTEYAHRASNAKIINDLAPFLKDIQKIRKNQRQIKEREIDDQIYELDDQEFNVRYNGEKWNDLWNQGEALAAAEQTAGAESDNPMFRKQAFLGDAERKNNQKMLTGMARDFPNWAQYAGENFEVEYPPNSGEFITRDGAGNYAEYTYAESAIRKVWLEQAAGSDDNPTNMYERRKFLHAKMKEAEQSARTKWLTAQGEAIDSNAQLRRDAELSDDLNARGGEALVAHINKYVGVYGGPNGYRESRSKTFDKTVEMAQAGTIDRSHYVKIGNYEFMGRDGKMHKIKDYWKEDYWRLGEAITAKESDDVKVKQDTKSNQINNWALTKEQELLKKDGPVTEEDLDTLLEDFKANFPGEGKLPDLIGQWHTQQDEDDDQIVKRLHRVRMNGGIIRVEDLKGITDSTTYNTWIGVAKESAITGMGADQIKTRDNRILRQVDAYTKEAHAEGKSVKWEANKEGATAYFNTQYSKYIKAHPDNPGGAFSEAWKDTRVAIKNGDFNTYVEIPLEETTAKNTKKALHAFSKDSNLPNTAVIPGTKDALRQMTEYIESGGRKGDIPAIYRYLASFTGDTPYAFGAKQVELGAKADNDPVPKFDEPKVDKDVKEQLTHADRILLLKKPSQGKANRVIQNAETLDWLLDNSKRFEDYNNILSPNGGDAHLEKPLTEHTISEVVDLLESGHEAPGAYAFTPTELLEALQTTGISGDRLYDEVTQDLLTLHLHKAHANRNYRGGFYTELMDLSPIQLEQAEEIVENIPPFNRNENILKALHN